MATSQHVQAIISVNSENFHETLQETVFDSSINDQSHFYEQLIAANDRLKVNISKIFTEFVNQAREQQQQTGGDHNKRKLKHDEDDDQEENEGEEDATSSISEEEVL